MDEEGLQNTDNELIHIGKPIEMDESLFSDSFAIWKWHPGTKAMTSRA